jgi:hypothetical protein
VPDDTFALLYRDGENQVYLDCKVVRVRINVPTPAECVPFATTFRLPMKNLDKPWYEAAHFFGPYNGHPECCEDWNLESGGDTDLGEPLVAPWSGIVINAFGAGGKWGMILRILGLTPSGELVTWMGAHLASIAVTVGEVVTVGQEVGTIGTGNGQYAAHLHEQIAVGAVPGPTVYGTDRRYDFRQPSRFYQQHGVDEALVKRVTERDGA